MVKKERVILIKGDSSKWYEQAIFIVNQNTPPEKIPMDFVAEAESIINNYIKKSTGRQANGTNVGIAYSSPKSGANNHAKKIPKKSGRSAKNRQFDFILNTILVLGCFFIIAALMWGLFL
ncbi:MAG: hypothetical protein FWC91_00940 [Defluviitaleaceae bacterium]|nr:hypothetical protein [Defluviitaleaceae bacterium]